MKCKFCDGSGKVVHPMMSMNGDEYTGEWEQHECEACNGTGVVEPLTNKEWFCSLSTEEKAKVLYDFYYNGQKDKLIYASINVNSFKEWLRHPHREE